MLSYMFIVNMTMLIKAHLLCFVFCRCVLFVSSSISFSSNVWWWKLLLIEVQFDLFLPAQIKQPKNSFSNQGLTSISSDPITSGQPRRIAVYAQLYEWVSCDHVRSGSMHHLHGTSITPVFCCFCFHKVLNCLMISVSWKFVRKLLQILFLSSLLMKMTK